MKLSSVPSTPFQDIKKRLYENKITLSLFNPGIFKFQRMQINDEVKNSTFYDEI